MKKWPFYFLLLSFFCLLAVIVGCEDQRIEPELLELNSSLDSAPIINYIGYDQTRRLVLQSSNILSLPMQNSVKINTIQPNSLITVEDAATSEGSEIWLYVSIPVYDCPCNMKGWIREADTVAFTEENRTKVQSDVGIYKGTDIYNTDDFKDILSVTPQPEESDLRGRLETIQDGYAQISSLGGRTFWVKEPFVIYPEVDRPYDQTTASLLKDKDYLLEAFSSVHDTAVGLEYTDEQLQQYVSDPIRKDYKATLEHFVTTELRKEIDTFQTVSRSVNPRTLLVTMKDHTVYKIYMQKDYNYQGIWKVTMYMDFYLNGNVDYANRYKQLKVDDLSGRPKEWAEKQLQSEVWKTEYMGYGGKTYVMVKTSSSQTDSVELDDIMVSGGDVMVGYQTFDYHPDRDLTLLNDYLLLELDYGEVSGVYFQVTYTTEQ